jgi:hypothetical protein
MLVRFIAIDHELLLPEFIILRVATSRRSWETLSFSSLDFRRIEMTRVVIFNKVSQAKTCSLAR